MCVSSCTVRTPDVTYVMVRLHIGYGALVVGAVRCDIAHWGSVRRHSRTTRSASCGDDAQWAVVVIVVHPGSWRSGLDGCIRSVRVVDDMGSRCELRAGFDVVVNFWETP